MKKIVLFGFLLAFAVASAQKIRLSNEVYNLPGEERIMYLDEYKSGNMLLYEFGDGQEMLSKNGTAPKDRLVKHSYEKPGNYVLKVYQMKGSDQVLITAENVEIKKSPTKLTLTKVTLSKYRSTKKDGRAWDNLMGSTYPDIYIQYYSKDRLMAESNQIHNVTPAMLPVVLDRNRVFDISKATAPLILYIYDLDSVTDSDFMVGVKLDHNATYLMTNEKDGVTFSYDGFEGKVEYKLD